MVRVADPESDSTARAVFPTAPAGERRLGVTRYATPGVTSDTRGSTSRLHTSREKSPGQQRCSAALHAGRQATRAVLDGPTEAFLCRKRWPMRHKRRPRLARLDRRDRLRSDEEGHTPAALRGV